MASALRPRPPRPERSDTDPGRRRFWRQPATVLAAVVLVVSVTTAAILQSRRSIPDAAAAVGNASISKAAVDAEVSAITAQPLYAAALGQSSTLSLAAPVDPKAVAAANGDPDDLRISLAGPGGAATTRPYTKADLTASVLTRLLYVTALRDLLALRHVNPSAADVAYGRQEAQLAAGEDASGANLFDRLPSWYQAELASRGADAAALLHALFGAAGVTDTAVQAAYDRRLGTDFTEVCIRSLVVPAVDTAAEGVLAAGGRGTRDDGCAPLSQWAPDVAVAVAGEPPGAATAWVQRGERVALLEVTRRTRTPRTAVDAEILSGLYAPYADQVDTMVEDELGALRVTVSPQYGTYVGLGTLHYVLAPDALTPPSPASPSPTPATSPPQRLDPFD